jgi:hypothetical protein
MTTMETEQQTSPGRDDASETASIEEIERTETPGVHTEPITDGKITLTLGKTLVNTTPWQHCMLLLFRYFPGD